MPENLSFRLRVTKIWKGRYRRIPGRESAFHVKRHNGSWSIVAYLRRESEVGTCAVVDSLAARQVTEAVNTVKRRLTGRRGGSFLINEFGQVLVPRSDKSGYREFVGEISGSFDFHNPFDDNETFNLNDTSGLRCGDRWLMPYVGIPYNSSSRNEIYFWRADNEGGQCEYPPVQDRLLLRALRAIRPYGAVRFLVTCNGVVLTKRPNEDWRISEKDWNPVFVGRINFSRWFAKEV